MSKLAFVLTSLDNSTSPQVLIEMSTDNRDIAVEVLRAVANVISKEKQSNLASVIPLRERGTLGYIEVTGDGKGNGDAS